MTSDQFDAACKAFCRRRPFRPFLIEFTSGAQMPVGHPESVRNEGHFYVARRADGGFVLLVADSVSRLLDFPTDASK
jgi:hypothetical protein